MNTQVRRIAVFALLALAAFLLVRLLSEPATPHPTVDPPEQAAEIASGELTRAIGETLANKAAEGIEVPPASMPPESSRSSISSSLLITDERGGPIPLVRVTWVSLHDDLFEGYLSQDSLDWLSVEASTLRFISDEQGRINLPRSPSHPQARSVLWLTHPHFAVTPVLLAPGEGPPAIVAMQPSRGIRVQVVRADGGSVAGATIVQVYFVGSRQGDGHLQDAARMFRQIYDVGSDGVVEVDPLLGEQGLRAELAGWLSPRWFGESPGKVELLLGPTFAISGRVEVPHGTDLRSVVVSTSVLTASDHADYDRRRLTAGGDWGPATIPVVSDALAVIVRAEAPGLVPSEVQKMDPVAGEQVFVTHRLQEGLSLEARVLDPDGEPVPTSAVAVGWQQEQEWVVRWVDVDPDGRATLGPVLPGSIQVEAHADGYGSARLGPFEYFEATAEPIVLRLTHAGTLRGTVTCEGKPVEDFTVCVFQKTIAELRPYSFAGRSDGSFELAEAPVGRLMVFAHAPTLTQGPVVEVEIPTSGEPVEVSLELPPPVLGRGIVVEHATGEPIPEARVELKVAISDKALQTRGAPLPVDARGRFEAQRFTPGENMLSITAPDCAETLVVAYPVDGVVDFGVIALERRQLLVVRLANPPPGRKCIASTEGRDFLPPIQFDASGIARFENVNSGSYTLIVTIGSERTFRRSLELVSGEEWDVTIDAARRPNCVVEVIPSKGEDLPIGATLGMCTRDALGELTREFIYLPENGIAEVWRPDGGELVLQVGDAEDPCITLHVVEANDPGTHIRVPIDARTARFRILHDGKPVTRATVGLQTAGDGARWFLGRPTDAAGEVAFRGVTSGALLVSAAHDVFGILPVVPVDFPEALGEGMVLELDVDATLSVRLTDGAVPLPGIPITFSASIVEQEVGFRSTDEDGTATLAPVAPGTYRVLVRHPSLWPVDQVLEAKSDNSPPTAVEARRRAELRIALTGPSRAGRPVHLTSLSVEGDPAAWLQEGLIVSSPPGMVTNAAGELRIGGLPHGEYRWSVEAENGDGLSGQVKLPPAGIEELRVSLP